MTTQPDMRHSTLCIVGLGLMGGSLGLALRGCCQTVLGVARRAETASQAVAMGAADRASTDAASLVPQADLVVLAAPVRTILTLLPSIAALMRPGALLTDLGSTKSAIVEAMSGLRPDIQVLGGHPLCGRELSGIAAAQADLFAGKPYVLTPLPRTSASALELGRDLALSAGSVPLVMDAERHDRLVAAISHLPYLVAAALASVAGRDAQEDALVWQLASSGFRDTSRLAASDAAMMTDILLTNGPNIARLARQAAHWLENAAAAAEGASPGEVSALVQDAYASAIRYRQAQASLPGAGSSRPSHPESGAEVPHRWKP
jgi:prephenate dehydrogenase